MGLLYLSGVRGVGGDWGPQDREWRKWSQARPMRVDGAAFSYRHRVYSNVRRRREEFHAPREDVPGVETGRREGTGREGEEYHRRGFRVDP